MSSLTALHHLLSDEDHQVRIPSPKVADYDAPDPLDVQNGVRDGAPAATTRQ